MDTAAAGPEWCWTQAGSPKGLRLVRAPKVATQQAYSELQDRGPADGKRQEITCIDGFIG